MFGQVLNKEINQDGEANPRKIQVRKDFRKDGGKIYKVSKGGQRYHVYLHKRVNDLHVYIFRGKTFAQNPEKSFKQEEITFVTKDQKELLNHLCFLKEKYQKKIVFHPKSVSLPKHILLIIE